MKKRSSAILLTAVLLLSSAGCTSDVTSSENDAPTAEATTTGTSATEAVTTTSAATETVAAAETTEQTEETADSTWRPEIAQRSEMSDNGYMCGVAYIGFTDDETDAETCRDIFSGSVYAQEFGLADIPVENVIDTGIGYELYLIIPEDPDASVTVHEWLLTEENDFAGSKGELYYQSESGAPILVKCNFSDIMPSTVISISDSDGRTLEWSPSMSLKDGSVSRYGAEDMVCDFTHYIYNETYECYIIEGEPQ